MFLLQRIRRKLRRYTFVHLLVTTCLALVVLTVVYSAGLNKRLFSPTNQQVNEPHLKQEEMVVKMDDVPKIPQQPPKPLVQPIEEMQVHMTVASSNTSDHYPPAFLPNSPPEMEDSNSQGPGHGGASYLVDEKLMSPKELQEFKDGWKKNSFNQFVSDRISVRRFLTDKREQVCKEKKYARDKLPKTSVVICFHNEAWTALLRSIHSVIDQTPFDLLEEILLVDDASTDHQLKEPLDDYLKQLSKVRVIRCEEREGLIRARIKGTMEAKAPVITFLDSHIECFPGWLEPLLEPIAADYRTVVSPVITVLNDKTLEVNYSPANNIQVGGFSWSLTFNWHYPPEKEKNRPGAPYSPIRTPTIAGGLFSIHRDFFRELGYYDPEFEVWGAENLELSFKTWMCHGTLYIVPCSQISHIFRKHSPYKWETKVKNPLKHNNDRLAAVWLDDYAKLFYQHSGTPQPGLGDIEPRLKIRQDLKCHSFKWYLNNVFPDQFDPTDALLSGRVRNPATNLCLDGKTQKAEVIPYPCHNLGGNQLWYHTKEFVVRHDEVCLDGNVVPGQVWVYKCHGQGGFQKFQYFQTGGTIESNGKCVSLQKGKMKIRLLKCNSNDPSQKWVWEPTDKKLD